MQSSRLAVYSTMRIALLHICLSLKSVVIRWCTTVALRSDIVNAVHADTCGYYVYPHA
jgi:hypothetical protein